MLFLVGWDWKLEGTSKKNSQPIAGAYLKIFSIFPYIWENIKRIQEAMGKSKSMLHHMNNKGITLFNINTMNIIPLVQWRQFVVGLRGIQCNQVITFFFFFSAGEKKRSFYIYWTRKWKQETMNMIEKMNWILSLTSWSKLHFH